MDVEAFEEAARGARRARSPSAYQAAVELYTGELLSGDPYEGWAEERRAQLRTLHPRQEKKKKGKKRKKRLVPQAYTVQFFSNPAPNIPTGFGEGQTFIGQTTVVTNTAGNAPINLTFTPEQAVSAGEFVTATATRNATGDTSEFSAARLVQ